MSRHATSFVLGYHGCDKEVGLRALTEGLPLEQSDKDYDWLGPGVYFWEGDARRAMEWAEQKAANGDYSQPFVIGAVIDLGNCLDLLMRENIDMISAAHSSFSKVRKAAGLPLPKNKDPRTVHKGDKLLRFLDCAVIRHLHLMIDDLVTNPVGLHYIHPFDTVRGLFVEGQRAYKGGGFFRKTHTQIAVRTDRCIKGIFVPRD